MRILNYPEAVSDIAGTYYDLADGEYVQIERATEGATVLWSTSFSLDKTLVAYRELFGPALEDGDEGEGYIKTSEGTVLKSSSRSAEEQALANPNGVNAFGAEYSDGLSAVWKSPSLKMRGDKHPTAEAGLVSNPNMPVQQLVQIARLTGTQAVREVFLTQRDAIVAALGDKALQTNA